MESLETIKKKIDTANDLLSVVKTMKSLAAVNIRLFEDAALSLEEYGRVVDLGWQALFLKVRKSLSHNPGDKAVCLVFGSDQGMCGQFNESILQQALSHQRNLKTKEMTIFFWSVGEKVRLGLEDEGHEVHEQFILPGGLSGVNGQVQSIVQAVETWQNSRGVNVFYLLYNRLAKEGGFEGIQFQLLPMDQAWFDRFKEQKWPARCLPMLGLSEDVLFSDLFRQYLFVSLYRAFAQSMAAENAARLRSMQAAEKNIEELAVKLQGVFRETRQNTITAELLDIIAGFEAVNKEDDH